MKNPGVYFLLLTIIAAGVGVGLLVLEIEERRAAKAECIKRGYPEVIHADWRHYCVKTVKGTDHIFELHLP